VREYRYEGGDTVEAWLVVKNEEANNLGIPLPRGGVRLLEPDPSGELELIGTSSIDHTAKDEKVELLIGRAFDIAAERTQTGYWRTGRHSDRVRVRVRIRNHKPTDVVVKVTASTGRGNWRITTTTHDFEKQDFRTVVFRVPVKAASEGALTFTVDRDWYEPERDDDND